MQFKSFVNESYAAKFGFESDIQDLAKRSPNLSRDENRPLDRFNLENVCDLMARHKIGDHLPNRLFFDQIQWGWGDGAVKLSFSTKFEAIIERQTHDLEGNRAWIAKKIINLKTDKNDLKEDTISEKLLDVIGQIYTSPHDNPKVGYKDFESLVTNIASEARSSVNDPLYFDYIQKLSDKKYILCFGVKGSGTQAMGQHRIEQSQIQLEYVPDTGLIKMFQTNIESTLSERQFALQPSDYKFTFAPTQNKKEIIDTISTMMKYY